MTTTTPPAVSIILPIHNGARYLEESLGSVFAQTAADWELIAVDDASSDATPAILASAAARDARVRVLRNEAQRGLPRTLNVGFAQARGGLLSWTSDDNSYRPDAISAMASALGERADADIVYADYTVIDGNGVPQEEKRLPSVDHLGYANIVGPCFLFRRRVYGALGGYSEDLFLAEDFDFWLRALPRFRFVHLTRGLYLYRVHAGALSSTRRDEIRRATAAALRRNLGALPRVARYEAHTRLEHIARDEGDASAARAHRRGAYRCAPLRALRRDLGAWMRGGRPH